MENNILNFLEAYKSLDEICKQILSTDKGISDYIDEMSNNSRIGLSIVNWEKDYKKLKKVRWIRNQLVHEKDSFQDNLVTLEDIKWLQNFRTRIIKCKDPIALLYQTQRILQSTGKNVFRSDESLVKKEVNLKGTETEVVLEKNETEVPCNFEKIAVILIIVIVLLLIIMISIFITLLYQ